jgi:truncated hemoglobin YjbI
MNKMLNSNYEPAHGYMTERIRLGYISSAIENKILPLNAHRMHEIVSLLASKSQSKPIQFWQLFSILGPDRIVRIVHRFYHLVFQDEIWFKASFERVGDMSHHVRTQSSMWLDVMGGGLKYHGAEFRLNFHHQHNALEVMNARGAERWVQLMVQALGESEKHMLEDPRVRISINTFLTHFMKKYEGDFGFKTIGMFGSTNAPVKSKLNFLNMTDASIEALSEPDLREGLSGRRVDVSEITDKAELIRKAKNL